jgi:hypothetical protein
MHHKYAAKGLVAVSVSLDLAEQRADAEKFLVKNKATFTNLWLDETQDFWTEKFKIIAPPCLFVYDRRGKWVQFKSDDKDIDHAAVEKLIVKLLAEEK